MSITIGRGTTGRELTDAEAIALTSGRDFWSTESVAGIASIRLSDGPHGLRYQALASDHLGINEAVPATAFPTASASASSWDVTLLAQMGAAIAEEARLMKVDIVLGPGVNLKRNPLGGRNFEYFSEDPFLAGKMAAAWINGLQGNGVGASLKHHARNSQETARLRSNSLIDATALHELYLEAFRLAVTEAQPETVMTAYNLVNGTYMTDHAYLLQTVLRDQWGFAGLVVSDWGALNDKVASLNAGTDLEMPSSGHLFDKAAKKALASGALTRENLTRAVEKIAAVADKKRPESAAKFADLQKQHGDLAQLIEENSAVLMKNDGALPLSEGRKLTVIGALAEKTRIQGAGSSHITTPENISILDGLKNAGHDYTYLPGYDLTGTANQELSALAVAQARIAEDIVVVLGLPDTAEAEGNDRADLLLPANQRALLRALTEVNTNVIVVLVAGSVVDTSWSTQVRAILNVFLGGQRVGAATERLLFGLANPSGKLAESYPHRYADVPSSALYNQQPLSVPYAESLYIGYRYYDKAQIAVAYPFGFGLSYTTFELSGITLNDASTEKSVVDVAVTVTNTGVMQGAEVVQVYVGYGDQTQLTPLKTLAAFQKIRLEPLESAQLILPIPQHALEKWDEAAQQFVVAGGQWHVYVGTSSQEIDAVLALSQEGVPFNKAVPKWYQQPVGLPQLADFTALSGLKAELLSVQKPGSFTRLSVPRDLAKYSRLVRKLALFIIASMQKSDHVSPESPEGKFLATIVWDTPLIRLAQQIGGSLKVGLVDFLVGLANHGRRR